MWLTRRGCSAPHISAFVWLLGIVAILSGCGRSLPKYQWSDDKTAIAALKQRAAAVRTLEATCTISMRENAGRHITLDGALAAQKPDHLRMRAWKFHHPALDFTATPEGAWVDASPDAAIESAFASEQLLRAWQIVNGSFLQRNLIIAAERSKSRQFSLVEHTLTDDVVIECFVDRKTLTPRRYEVRNHNDELLYVIRLDRYRQAESIIWPHQIVFDNFQGRLTIEFVDVEFNAEPAANAFVPPRRAVRQH